MAKFESVPYSLFETKKQPQKRSLSRETQELVVVIKGLRARKAVSYEVNTAAGDTQGKAKLRLSRVAKICKKKLDFIIEEDRKDRVLFALKSKNSKLSPKRRLSDEEKSTILSKAKDFGAEGFRLDQLVENLAQSKYAKNFALFKRFPTVVAALLRTNGFTKDGSGVYSKG